MAQPTGYPGGSAGPLAQAAGPALLSPPQLPDLTIFGHSDEFRAPRNSKFDSGRTAVLRRKPRTLLSRNISVTENLGLKSRQKPLSGPRFDYF